jgi:hypothetical protein
MKIKVFCDFSEEINASSFRAAPTEEGGSSFFRIAGTQLHGVTSYISVNLILTAVENFKTHSYTTSKNS